MTPLRAAREAAGYRTRPAAVAALLSLAAHRRVTLTATRESLTRMMRGWENGDHEVKEPYLGLLCVLFGRSADELGLSASPTQARSDTGLVYAASLAEALGTLADLAKFDEQQHPGVISGPFSESAVTAACLDWLFGRPQSDLTATSGTVTSRDVAEILATVQIFDGMDRQYGGDHSRSLAVKYLHDTVLPWLRSSYSDRVGADLFHAAAILCELIGYMAYDGGKHSLAQRYFIQSLRLARSAGDTAYGAYVLNTMSHQALYLNRPREALRLAQAARQTYHGEVVPAVRTEAAMLEAQAYAALGERTGSIQALSAAETTFATQSAEGAPPWAAHWSQTLFSTFVGDCWLRLGDAQEARPHLLNAWHGAQEQSRRKVFAAGQLAKVALLERDVDQAAGYALVAAESVDSVRSRRSLQVVSDLYKELSRHTNVPPVRTFANRARHVLGR